MRFPIRKTIRNRLGTGFDERAFSWQLGQGCTHSVPVSHAPAGFDLMPGLLYRPPVPGATTFPLYWQVQEFAQAAVTKNLEAQITHLLS